MREISLSYCVRIANKSEQMQRRFGNKSNIKTSICSAITIELKCLQHTDASLVVHANSHPHTLSLLPEQGTHTNTHEHTYARPSSCCIGGGRQTSVAHINTTTLCDRHRHASQIQCRWVISRMHSTVRACWNE